MSSSRSSQKRASRTSFKPVPPFDLFYQLTYMSAMAAAGITRVKTFELAAQSKSKAADYFAAVNTLVKEMRYDYPDACKLVGQKAASENMRSFLLRFSDALRSGEPLAEFLNREATVQAEDYQNNYERNLESLKQWSNAFSSIVISVALIIIIQVISSMIYSSDLTVMGGLVFTGVAMSSAAAWIIWRSAPQEIMIVSPSKGSKDQRLTLRMFKIIMPTMVMLSLLLLLIGLNPGYVLMIAAAMLLPIGIVGSRSDKQVIRKDVEFSTFLRSTGGMATSSGTTLKEALTKIDLASFPNLEEDINRLGKRLQARIDPDLCWHRFGQESGSRLISEVVDIFYGAVKIGGDPERVGYVCSVFAAKTTQLRAKRRLVSGTFSGLTTVMQGVVAVLMIFVLSIVRNFSDLVQTLMPTGDAAQEGQTTMKMTMAQFSPEQLSFLSNSTMIMVVMLAIVAATAMVLTDGGFKLKVTQYLAFTVLISGLALAFVPSMVNGILQM